MAEKRVLPKILVWADRTTDKLAPGYMAHAIASDGTIILQRLMQGDNIGWVQNELTGLNSPIRSEYNDAYPGGYDLIWVIDPDNNWDLIAAQLASEHRYEFRSARRITPGGANSDVTRMHSLKFDRVVGYIVHKLGAHYAVPRRGLPKPDAILPEPPYATPLLAARKLHEAFLEGQHV